MGHSHDSSRADAHELFLRARAGDDAAWFELFEIYQPKLVRAVRRRMSPALRPLYDSVDVAEDVWGSLFVKRERFEFETFEEIEQHLIRSAREKIIDEYRRLHALKRDAARNRSIDGAGEDADDDFGLRSPEPSASKVAVAKESLDLIEEGRTRDELKVIHARLENRDNDEIAAQVGWSQRKVQRFLQKLREKVAPGHAPSQQALPGGGPQR